jgi:hypothetical protein
LTGKRSNRYEANDPRRIVAGRGMTSRVGRYVSLTINYGLSVIWRQNLKTSVLNLYMADYILISNELDLRI